MNFIKKLFGKATSSGAAGVEGVVTETLSGLLDRSGLELSFEIEQKDDGLHVEMFGEDGDLLKDREGQLLDAIQFFVKRVIQHRFPEERLEVQFDSNGFREETNQALIELADRLKEAVLAKNKSMYVKALPPKERKVIHQHLANDERVKSRSIGEGHYKRIKIYPAKGKDAGSERGSSGDGSDSYETAEN